MQTTSTPGTVKLFTQWLDSAVDSGPVVHCCKTALGHVKVEQIVAAAYRKFGLDLDVNVTVTFEKFIIGKPELYLCEKPHASAFPSMRIYHGDKIIHVYDTGKPLDEFADYACPIYPHRVTQRNRLGFIVTDPDTASSLLLDQQLPEIRAAAMFRFYAEIALEMAKLGLGYDFLINRQMDNLVLTHGQMLRASLRSSGGPLDRIDYAFSWNLEADLRWYVPPWHQTQFEPARHVMFATTLFCERWRRQFFQGEDKVRSLSP